LLPREAVRLAALGLLAAGPSSYGALAEEVRHFASRVAGPSLELMGPSVELLRHEGLVRPIDGAAGAAAMLALTDAGREELHALLRSAVRAPLNDVNKLVLALKFRFLHLLPPADQRTQLAMMVEACEVELARLIDLRTTHAGAPGYLTAWLDHDIATVRARLDWLTRFHATMGGGEDALRTNAARR
jgi:DNA-binding PadR family transcriptional regulator